MHQNTSKATKSAVSVTALGSFLVKQKAIEFGLSYNTNGSFISAVTEHFKLLKVLGSMEVSQSKSTSQ